MSAENSILDRAFSCRRLHGGGEADIYVISEGESEFVLKWYRKNAAFDSLLVEKLARLRIPGIYRVRESSTRDGKPYLVYDYVKGVSSLELGKIPVVVALCMLRSVANTLLSLDTEGIHHGDLNPANVLLSMSGKKTDFPLQTTLVDFGILGPGVPAYAAPERFQGKSATTSSDLFSLGMLLYRWVMGDDLILASGYDEFLAQSLKIDSIDIDKKLYESGSFSANEIAALSPLWRSLLRFDAGDRCEDFDELGELIEIALDTLGVGEVKASSEAMEFAEIRLEEKAGRNVSETSSEVSETAFPYKKQGVTRPKKRLKYCILAVFGLILILIVLFVVAGTKSSSIDETGDLLLERSRNLESATMESENGHEMRDTMPSTILMDLPIPASD
ncbi:protein kinase [uncultured Fibrobacter sp.]|uniref:serine/threonine protein kinase n=1 Tax=uncultured Fibrobacter sp. TaxID=261512 RepID=UPI00262E8F7D|nr:protein kinase [uncultured Fibrobacter sp.]